MLLLAGLVASTAYLGAQLIGRIGLRRLKVAAAIDTHRLAGSLGIARLVGAEADGQTRERKLLVGGMHLLDARLNLAIEVAQEATECHLRRHQQRGDRAACAAVSDHRSRVRGQQASAGSKESIGMLDGTRACSCVAQRG